MKRKRNTKVTPNATNIMVHKDKREVERFTAALAQVAAISKVAAGINYTKYIDQSATSRPSSSSNDRELGIYDVNRRDSSQDVVTASHHKLDAPQSRQKRNDKENPTTSSSSKRPRRRATQPQRDKVHVKYNISKVPQFKRSVSFLRVIRELEEASQPNNLGAKERRDVGHELDDQSFDQRDGADGSRPALHSRKRKKSESTAVLGDSVIWLPQTREDWFDCASEMVALCAEAALRSALSHRNATSPNDSRILKLRDPVPLSKEYVRDRIDIDDPLRGYQIRHAEGGWLQGFITWTTFTTWTRYFRWDSLHPKCGLASNDSQDRLEKYWDASGSLSSMLDAQKRSGDPLQSGVIWPTVAEIGLVGGLGCGEYLLRLAIADICEQNCYKCIVLQATESSMSFYEKFGFVRVGAVCKYGDSRNVEGYRHWTYADEQNLAVHGGPSLMMAKRIEFDYARKLRSELVYHKSAQASFYQAVLQYFVQDKPFILSLNKQDAFLETRFPISSYSSDESICKGLASAAVPCNAATEEEPRENCDDVVVPPRKRPNLRQGSLGSVSGESESRCSCPAVSSFLEMQNSLCPDGMLRKQTYSDRNNNKNKPFFYNKVVVPKSHKSDSYYFVIQYNKAESTLLLIKLERDGVFSGKREGRTRYRACRNPEYPCYFLCARACDWVVVTSMTTMKTPVVKDERWDIL